MTIDLGTRHQHGIVNLRNVAPARTADNIGNEIQLLIHQANTAQAGILTAGSYAADNIGLGNRRGIHLGISRLDGAGKRLSHTVDDNLTICEVIINCKVRALYLIRQYQRVKDNGVAIECSATIHKRKVLRGLFFLPMDRRVQDIDSNDRTNIAQGIVEMKLDCLAQIKLCPIARIAHIAGSRYKVGQLDRVIHILCITSYQVDRRNAHVNSQRAALCGNGANTLRKLAISAMFIAHIVPSLQEFLYIFDFPQQRVGQLECDPCEPKRIVVRDRFLFRKRAKFYGYRAVNLIPGNMGHALNSPHRNVGEVPNIPPAIAISVEFDISVLLCLPTEKLVLLRDKQIRTMSAGIPHRQQQLDAQGAFHIGQIVLTF